MPARLHRCVDAVKAGGAAVNPWAVCVAALKRKAASRKREAAAKKRVKRI